jgi:2-methylcitrate dehydratase PrpD
MDGEMTWRQRLDKRLRDPETHELAARIHITEDPEMSKNYPNEWPVQMDIHLRNGKVVSRRLDQVKWSPRRPATWDELAEKFIGMGELVIGKDRAQQAVDWIARLEKADSLAPLLDLLRR